MIIGNGDPIMLPYGRDRIDWEVELGDGHRPLREVRAGEQGG